MALEIIPELCIGCTACSKHCPVDCISGENKQIHWIDPTSCIDCTACGIVCPTEAILDKTGLPIRFHKKKSERPIAVIDEVFCSGCDFCSDFCPFDCLEIIRDVSDPMSRSVVKMVNEKNCVACRLCEDVCQKDAIIIVNRDGTPYVAEGRADFDVDAA